MPEGRLRAPIAIVALGSLCADVAIAETAIDLKKHKPRFHWETRPNGAHGIRDGEMRVARFHGGAKKMRGIGRPISLHDLRLIPGGPPAIAKGEACGPLCLSWRKHLIFYMKIDELTANEADPERFELYVRSHDIGLRKDRAYRDAYEPNNVVEESWLTLTYDPNLPSYVFDVRTRMTVRSGREQRMISRDLRGLEFGDILPAMCNVPLDKKQFHYYVYKGRDGVCYRLPHDKHRGPEKRRILYARDGTFAFLLAKHHNPVIELVGESGRNTFSEICHAMYDVHFKFAKEKELKLLKAGKPLEIRFRLYSISEEAGREMLAHSVWDPKLQLPSARKVPLRIGVSHGFEPSAEGLHPTRCFSSKTAGSECAWDPAMGYRSRASLMIRRRSKQGGSAWQAWFDPRYVEGLRPGDRYRVKAMVRIEGVSGEAKLVWEADGKRVSSGDLSGTTKWTRLTLETGPVSGAGTLKLVQGGAGQSWFDDVLVSPIP